MKKRFHVFNMINIFPDAINTEVLREDLLLILNEFKNNLYPKTLKELSINGNDLMLLGFNGKEIKDTQNLILNEIFSDK